MKTISVELQSRATSEDGNDDKANKHVQLLLSNLSPSKVFSDVHTRQMVYQKTAKTQQSQKTKKNARASCQTSINSTTKSLVVYGSSSPSRAFGGTVHAYLTARASPKKRREIRAAAAELEQDDAAGKCQDNEAKKKRKSQTMAALLAEFTDKFSTIADHVLASESDPVVGQLCSCGEGHRTTRCKDCSMLQPVCDSCFLKTHEHLPFHFPEKWNGEYFVKMSQADIGRIIHFGHDGLPCPDLEDEEAPLNLNVVQLNGVHKCKVHYCACLDKKEKWEQLLMIDLFPGSMDTPKTAFSFALLKHFDLLSSISKVTAMDFVTTIRRTTNNAFPEDVPDFYGVFRRVMRVWRALQIRKRAGEFHGMQTLTKDASEFSLALKCPACPQPGFNMDLKWAIEASEEDKHKYTLFLSIDGNFKQQLKIKNCDMDDIELFVAFFARKGAFEEYMKEASCTVEKSTCANLKANNLQSQLKFVSMLVSGVVSCKCARHDMYRPGSTVDLKKGESFAYTDFALRRALEGFEEYELIDLSYDIACQYCKKVGARFKLHFKDCDKAMAKMRFHIPKLHGHGHTDGCRYEYSFDYAKNVGRTHGERIEGGWSEGNLSGPATREMNPGHRHETLSAFYNEWNYQQTIKLSLFLANKVIETRRQIKLKSEHFEKLTESMGDARIEDWNKFEAEAAMKDNAASVLYAVKEVKFPSMEAIESRLAQEPTEIYAPSAHVKPAKFIADGVKLETRQYALQAKAKSDDASLQRVNTDIMSERLKLRNEIGVWRDDQSLYMTEVLDLVSESKQVESEGLFLPSSLPKKYRKATWFKSLAGFERAFRKGQADDALNGLRLALKYKDNLENGKRRHAYSNRNSTRSAVLLRRVANLVQSKADAYRRAREALISLGMTEADTSYPVLAPEHVKIKATYKNKKLGEGKFTGSWIWNKGPRGILSNDEEAEWEEEGNRVEWFRARLDLQQRREEYDILEEELKRTAMWFNTMANLWRELGKQLSKPGYREFALQKADMNARGSAETVEQRAWAITTNIQEEEQEKSTG